MFLLVHLIDATIPIITHLWNTDFVHWWHLYFQPVGKPWYEGQVWGNVFAVLPLAVLAIPTGIAAYIWHKGVVKDLEKEVEKHKVHSKIMQDLVKVLDPTVEGGALNDIKEALNTHTPGGLTEVLDAIHNKK